MEESQKKTIVRLIIGVAFFLLAKFLPISNWFSTTSADSIQFILYLIPYLIIGGDVVWRAIRNISHGEVFDENFLMVIATIGAFCLKDYSESVAVMLFYQIGELFQDYAVDRSRESITSMLDIRPDIAFLEKDGTIVEVNPGDVKVGEIIVVKPGERVPLDGIAIEGSSQLNTAALTGESMPVDVSVNDTIISGSVNLSGLLKIRVTKLFGESTVSRILELVENASEKKAKSENFITKFARVYTPVVVFSALFLAVVPPLLLGQNWSVWINRALIFLVVSCPCALVISIPLSFFGGIGGASKNGILVKGSNYLEALADTRVVVFDKTGTLTNGTFTVIAVHPNQYSEADLLDFAACAEAYSDHPIAQSIKAANKKKIDLSRINDVKEVAGHGMSALIDSHKVLLGNNKMMARNGIEVEECHITGTNIHVAIDGEYAGHIVISDTVKPDSKQAIDSLKSLGISKTVMLTGDKENVAANVAQELGIDEYHAGLLPADKVDLLEKLLNENKSNGQLAFVGDGINDAPVLTRADIGIAMGAMGSDAAIEAADVVLMNDKPSNIAKAIKIARKTLTIVHQNIAFALGVKALVLILAAFGVATMWEAVFADVGVAFIAILNAMRALKTK